MTEPPELEFPMEWDGRVIAVDDAAVPGEIRRVIQSYGFASAVRRGNVSSGGRFVTFHVALVFETRDVLHAVTAALAEIDGVRVVL